MIDLHTHTLFSDGVLLPSELVRRAEVFGYEAIALTDHADASNFDFILPRIIKACEKINAKFKTVALPGIELTHVHPEDISGLVEEVRDMGARVVVVHGETIAEPVLPGTNRSALESDIDILAHPGLISGEEMRLAADRHISIELTARQGHSLTNGHVAMLAEKHGACLVLNTDAHAPGDLISLETASQIAEGAGLAKEKFEVLLQNSRTIVKKALAL